jgi:hypothetical protein
MAQLMSQTHRLLSNWSFDYCFQWWGRMSRRTVPQRTGGSTKTCLQYINNTINGHNRRGSARGTGHGIHGVTYRLIGNPLKQSFSV